MKEHLRLFAAWLDASRKAKWLFFWLQVSFGSSLSLYLNSTTPLWQNIWGTVSISLFALMLLWSAIVMIFHSRYGLNVLVYKRKTGILYDKGLDIENVALRRASLHKILKGFLEEKSQHSRVDLLRETGENIGHNFVTACRQRWRRHRNTQFTCDREVLEELFEYDSSSGWGKFSLDRFDQSPQEYATIEVRNPFTVIENNGGNKLNAFLLGYLEGIFKAVCTSRKFEAIEVSTHKEGDCTIVKVSINEKQQQDSPT